MAYLKHQTKKNFDEVTFAQHIYEFVRFYHHHQRLNEEISGLREITFKEKGKEKTITITKSNFWFGIKRLHAFMLDYIHYIRRYEDVKRLERAFENLELDFVQDKKYKALLDKSNRSATDEVTLNFMYISYLVRCFEIASYLCILLQNTLMITIKATKREIGYRDDAPFFESRGRYRDVLANDLANFKLGNIIHHYKGVLGYYYTYKILLIKEERVPMDALIRDVTDYITSKQVMDTVIYIKSNMSITSQQEQKIKHLSIDIKNMLYNVYKFTNSYLKKRGIDPNPKTKETQDFTLI